MSYIQHPFSSIFYNQLYYILWFHMLILALTSCFEINMALYSMLICLYEHDERGTMNRGDTLDL